MDEPHLGDSAKENESAEVKSDLTTRSQQTIVKNLENVPQQQSVDKSSTKSSQQRRSSACGPSSVRHRRFFYSKKQYSESQLLDNTQPKNVRNGTTAGYAREKRTDFANKRVYNASVDHQHRQCKNKNWSAENSGRIDKFRSFSTTANTTKAKEGASKNETSIQKKECVQRKRNSTTDLRTTSTNSVSNGESFDYDEMELDEPFSESEDETSPRAKAIQKPCLIIPRGRIRSLSGTIPPVGFSPRWGGPTMCLSCLQFFQLPEMISDFSTHLLTEHQIVIDGMEIIVDLKRYIEHWRQQFAKRCIANIFPRIEPKEGDAFFGKVDFYFLMNESVKEDYVLRQHLAMRRLEEALACQQREREDTEFSMQCIFCRYMARGNRSKIIHHLYTIHHLNLGSPDNLVFVTEYIEHLREKLLRNECIYCEKTYADRNVLMEHMRKKNHREVNPKNNYYDKFYIINYLELGKRWLDVLAEDFEDTMPTFVDSDEEEEEESWHEWQEDNADEEELCTVCLFCDFSMEKLDDIVKHMNENHKFDLFGHIQAHNMDTYSRMKFVNFLRKRTFNTRKGSSAETTQATVPDKDEWDKDENLVPMFGNDHLLWMLESWCLEKEINEDDMQQKAIERVASADNEEMSISCDAVGIPKVNMKALVEESKKNTVEGVTAEDLPDLSDSVLASAELQQSLR